jgi:hypothetical protein
MQFAVFLVDNGVITCEDFFEALKLQMHSRPQLGALAIELHVLTCRQVFSILRVQCDEPNQLFGEIAVRLGYLTQQQLTELLEEQTARLAPLGDILVEHGFLSPEVAEVQYAEFRRCLNHPTPAMVAAV